MHEQLSLLNLDVADGNGQALLFLSLRAARMNHSCAANACLISDRNDESTLCVASRIIHSGEEICRSYAASPLLLLHSRRDRRQELAQRFGFVCSCSACLSDSTSSTSSGKGAEVDTGENEGLDEKSVVFSEMISKDETESEDGERGRIFSLWRQLQGLPVQLKSMQLGQTSPVQVAALLQEHLGRCTQMLRIMLAQNVCLSELTAKILWFGYKIALCNDDQEEAQSWKMRAVAHELLFSGRLKGTAAATVNAV